MEQRVLRAAAVAALASSLFLPTPGRAAGDEAAALLAKHQAYVGWHVGDGAVKTLREIGGLQRADGTFSRSATTLRYGVAHRTTSIDGRGIHSDDGFTGSVYWTSNENGFTVRPVGEIARYLVDYDAIFGELAGTYAPQIVRHETVEGVDAVLLHLTHQVGFPMDVDVDPATGAFLRVTIDPGGKYEETIKGLKYTTVDGKRFISSWQYAQSRYKHVYTSIEANIALEPDALRPPKQTATWTFGDGVAKVKLTQDTLPRINLDATINGVPGHFLLDTGAGATAVTDSFARRVGAKRIGDTSISGVGGSAKAGLFRVDTIGIGPSTLHNVVIYSGLSEDDFRREGVDGLIGFDMLGGAIVELDLDAGTLRIQDPAKVQPDETKGMVAHVDLSNRTMRVPMKLNDKVDVIATLDSGNPVNVLFSTDLVFRDHVIFFVDPNQYGSTRYGGGVGGDEIEHCGKLQSLALGPINYRPVPACDSPSYGRNEILVGLDFMKNFNYVFDYPDGIVVMTPRR